MTSLAPITANDIEIPAFALRGASRWDDTLSELTYRSEADLRDALAASWWLHGADVRTEVKVPDCGRIDVLVAVGDTELIIEVKRKITTPTEARQAFQQAHAYLSFRDASTDARLRLGRSAIVTSADHDYSACERARAAFEYSVTDYEFGSAMSMPYSYFTGEVALRLADEASRRQLLMRRLTSLSRIAEIAQGRQVEDEALREMGRAS